MIQFLINPFWFFGFDVVFSFVFAFITLAVSYYSFKFYKLSGQNKSKYLGIGFGLFSFSYILHAFFSLASFSNLENFEKLVYLGTYLHMLFFIWGSATLVYMVLNLKKPGLHVLLVIMALSSFIFSGSNSYLGYITLSILLFYVFFYYLLGFIKKNNSSSFIVTLSFGLLFLSEIHFIFSSTHYLFYAAGNLIALIAYLVLLIKLVVVVTK